MGTRADNRDGSCKQVKSGRLAGRWRVQFSVVTSTGAKKRLSRIFPSQTEGKDFLRSLIKSENSAQAVASKEMTVRKWFDWLNENDWEETLAEPTRKGRMARFKKYSDQVWGGVPLTKVDPMKVKAWYKQLRDSGLGHATREAIKGDLVRAFNQAISPYKQVPIMWGNPFKLPMDSAPRRDAVALTPKEAVKALKSKNLTDLQRAQLGVFLLAGLRLSEMMALTKRQVNFKEGLIYVDQSVKIGYGGGQAIGLPKGDKKRVAVMCNALKLLLQTVTIDLVDGDFIFTACTENKPRMKKLSYATWRKILRDAGLPAEMTPHDGRLTHINWIEKLMPDVSSTTLKEHIGHAASGVTEVNYTRPITSAQDVLRASLDNLIKL